ncbi:transmembrane protein 26-like [Mizuhopecten yessoensis]|uniref:Transmembrane protein 26 n=1 Tax=Mizuhopecten yessoensis TaxID=6573 RepID=A0A210QYM2_MIZYE|nr:transmembrane protein 26-like [Mizuhopecten yessoensis]OWF53802.1 Transmembrane protein 26 [Mizuhopecten yessoensis]
MRCMTIIRALLVRVLFAVHGVIAIWRLFMVIRKPWCWYLTGALGGLLIETIITLTKKKGKEWKWFCPSVFFYLGSVVPAIWFLELHEMEDRIALRESSYLTNSTGSVFHVPVNRTNKEDLSVNIEGLQITIPLAIPANLWLRILEQFLLLMLIVGRWLLPKGSLSHDQLSQLLLVYVGTAADIVEFYEAFSEELVMYNRLLCYIILGIWTLSLLQFTLVLTATRARRDHSGVPSASHSEEDQVGCCNPEIYGIVTSILMQDCPFLVIRLLLIFKYGVISYTNMFFTSKNSLVIVLLMYRVIVVQGETRRRKKEEMKKSNSAIRLNVPNNISGFGGRIDSQLYMKPSCSAPNVYKATQSDSLPRYKNSAVHDRRSDPMDSTKLYVQPARGTPPRSPSNCRPIPRIIR